MSETLTVDTTPQTETLGESLTADEQDSLAVGEQLIEQQEQLLAGKYKDAEALEKAYVELSKKLGEKSEADTEETKEESETVDEKPTEDEAPKDISPATELITSASDEFYNNDGKLSPETIEKFSSMSSKDLVEAYMKVQGDLPQYAAQAQQDISDAAVNEVKNFAGGEKSYQNLIDWAGSNLDQNSIQAFDSIINTGNVEAIKIAVTGLKAQYENANGYEGRMVTGKSVPPQKGDVFRSQAELVEAMSDRRYERDPAYRQDVIEKLDRSDLQF